MSKNKFYSVVVLSLFVGSPIVCIRSVFCDAFLHGAVVWSAVCDCGISWSYSIQFFVHSRIKKIVTTVSNVNVDHWPFNSR